MITDYDPSPGEDTALLGLNSVTEFFNAKAYLQTISKESSDNL